MVHAGLAVVHEAVEGRTINSPTAQFVFPKVIRLLKRVYIKYRSRTPACSKKGVLKRDKWTCVYCSRSANTVDHIVPRAKGGLSTWENLAAACQPCNNRKADKTLEEAGLRLQWIPAAPEIEESVLV
jgi:5-methylcytosine-specific restriction endonuclease McrA